VQTINFPGGNIGGKFFLTFGTATTSPSISAQQQPTGHQYP